MLKELKISNFRGYDDEVTVRFAPITILIGRNNAGKSSIIKFLLMLQQSINYEGGGFLTTQGSGIDLGELYEHKNVNSHKKYMKFSLSVKEEESPRDALSLYLRDIKVEQYSKRIICTTEATILYNKNNPFQGKEHKISLKIGDKGKDLLVRSGNIHQNSSFLDFSDEQKREIDNVKFKDEENIFSKVRAEYACMEILRDDIGGLKHISPVKEEIQSAINTRVILPKSYVGKKGNFAVNHLWEIMEYANPETRKFVNDHMRKVLCIKDIKFKSLGRLAQCDAKNEHTEAITSLDNFGFGVSECIPIIVQGAIMHPGTTLMVEQPEAQVHPTAQLSLGQFFADLWKERRVSSIIETHSGNILLRLRRLINKGDIDPNDVSVAFFENRKGQVRIKNLNVRADGSFNPGLPIEFFGADVLEGLRMGAGK